MNPGRLYCLALQTSVTIGQGVWQQFARHQSFTSLSIPIPLTASPSFETSIGKSCSPLFLALIHVPVNVSWRLSFEFVVGKKENEAYAQFSVGLGAGADHIAVAPKEVQVETMRWSLPITVLPCDPLHLPLTQAAHTLIL